MEPGSERDGAGIGVLSLLTAENERVIQPCSGDGLSHARMDKHHLMRCWHSGENPGTAAQLQEAPAHLVPPSAAPRPGCAQSRTQTSCSMIRFGGEQDGRTRATSSS
ncbi:uncharacterized protein ACIB01_001490 [Guaruba guarouba]